MNYLTQVWQELLGLRIEKAIRCETEKLYRVRNTETVFGAVIAINIADLLDKPYFSRAWQLGLLGGGSNDRAESKQQQGEQNSAFSDRLKIICALLHARACEVQCYPAKL